MSLAPADAIENLGPFPDYRPGVRAVTCSLTMKAGGREFGGLVGRSCQFQEGTAALVYDSHLPGGRGRGLLIFQVKAGPLSTGPSLSASAKIFLGASLGNGSSHDQHRHRTMRQHFRCLAAEHQFP